MYILLGAQGEKVYIFVFFISQHVQILETCQVLPSVLLKTLVYKVPISILN